MIFVEICSDLDWFHVFNQWVDIVAMLGTPSTLGQWPHPGTVFMFTQCCLWFAIKSSFFRGSVGFRFTPTQPTIGFHTASFYYGSIILGNLREVVNSISIKILKIFWLKNNQVPLALRNRKQKIIVLYLDLFWTSFTNINFG